MTLVTLAAVSVPTGWFVCGVIAVAFLFAVLLSGLFGPLPRYRIVNPQDLPPNDSEDFLHHIESLADTVINRTGSFEVLTNGENFYPAMLEAIRAARHSISLEAYIFQRGQIATQFVDALTERARAGVDVNVLVDFFGSLATTRGFFRPLLEAGGQVFKYNTPNWHNLTRIDSRTHRELLIVDGRTGFIGGAGIADHWLTGVRGHPRWRDTMVRVHGDCVPNLQATFSENWLVTAGEILVGERYFPTIACEEHTAAMVINSTPTSGGGTRARLLFQLLLASARHSIVITTPYFLPDRGIQRELCNATERGVRVRILVPGHRSDHFLTRSTSRGGYGPLLKARAELHEYSAAMIHAKVLIVDDLWSVVGSTNFDNRSFGINDEVNLAVRDAALAARLNADFIHDLASSEVITLRDWNRRSFVERAPELLGWIFERQQ